MNAQSVNSLSGQKKFTCRIGASEWFSNRLGCNDSPNGEPENPGSDDWLSTMYACCQDGMAGTSPMGRSDGTSGQKPAGVFSNPEYSRISSSVRCGTWLARSVPGKLGFRLSVKSRKQSSGSVLKSHRFSSSFGCASVKV
jgi:hypothetical protein